MKNKEKYNLKDLIIQQEDCTTILKNNNHKTIKTFFAFTPEMFLRAMFVWLEQEYKDPLKLTDDEIAILKNADKCLKYIVRNSDGVLFLCEKEPKKGERAWVTAYRDYFNFNVFRHMFQNVTWFDEKPCAIDELLKMNGVER